MKRNLSILLAIILILGQVPFVSLAAPIETSTHIVVEEIEITGTRTPNTIMPGEEFNLSIKLNNISTSRVTNIMVSVDNPPGFRIVGTGSKKFTDEKEIASNGFANVDFKLKYNGGDNLQVPITIFYTLDGKTEESSSSDSIYITQAQAEKEEEKYDGSKDTPSISIVSSKTVLGESGTSISLPIEIKNNGAFTAKNVTTTLELEGDSPLYIDGSGNANTSRLFPGRSENLAFKIKADKKAEDKTYPIKVNFQFYNEYDVPFTATDTVYVKITDSKSSAQVVINRVDIKPAMNIQPGGMVTVGFEVENKGDKPARDVKISLKGLSNEGFSLKSGLNSQGVPLLERGKTRYLYFQVQAGNRMASGNHELEMVLSYKDMKNVEVIDESKFFIPVASNKNQSSNLIIQDISYPTGAIGINKDVDVSFSIKNQGQTKAQNIIITAESMDQAGLVPKTVSVIKLNNLDPGGVEKINYKFLTTASAETKNYPINILVEYVDELSGPEEKSSVNQFLGIFVLAPEPAGEPGEPIKSTPRLIIDKYVFEPKLVEAGENFEMHLSFFNTNSSKTVKNIKIFLTAEANPGTEPNSPSSGSSVFTPVDSSNTFYIDSIPPKGRVEKAITMFTVPDAVAKTHMITANFEYEDNSGEAYTATELIGVPVIQQSKLEIGELSVMPEAFVGDLSPVSLEFYNTGKVTLYNMMVKLEGDFQTESGSYYIGNFENGSSEFFEGMIIPSQPGLLEGAVVFTYEDSTGQAQEVRKEFSLNVSDMPPMEDFPDDYPMEEEGSGGIKGLLKSKWLWIGLAIIAGGFGGFKFYKKHKQRKEDEELSLDE